MEMIILACRMIGRMEMLSEIRYMRFQSVRIQSTQERVNKVKN